MVNGKVIRGGGFLVIVGSYIWLDQTFTNNVVNKAKTVYGGLIGGGLGSMYNACSSDSDTLKKLTSVSLVEKPHSDLKYSFYSIDNPKEYLDGSNANVIEKGPYALRKYSVAHEVAQTPSSLTSASSPDPNGNLEYSTANVYLVLDRDVASTSNMERNADLSLTFSDTKMILPTAKRALASHLSMNDSIVNLSPDYLSFLGVVNDEVNMILSLKCTSEQITNIGSGKSQCTDNELGDFTASNCACCMMDDDFELAKSRNTGTPPPFTNCNSYFDDEGPIMSMLSLLASHDGGVAIKSAGEKKYDRSGNNFSSTIYGQTQIHTALIQSHSVNDLMFGFPSAYLGRVAFLSQIEYAKRSLSSAFGKTELAKRMLTGQVDEDLPFKLGNAARYTSQVGSVCFSACEDGGGCSGYAPGRHETTNVDKIKLGGINCKPYTTTFDTIAKCKAVDAALQVNPNADGFEMCHCADGSDDWTNKGCCLASGMHNHNDLSGQGCLFEVAGIVDPNYAGLDMSIAGAIDLGTALQTWIDKEVSEPSAEFLCPAAGLEIDEHAKFGHYDSFAGSDEHITYYHTGNDRIRQDDVSSAESKAHTTAVSGSSGKYFQPKGLFVKVGTSQISDGYPMKIPHPVYVPDAKRSVDFVFEGVREKFVRNKICGTDTCVVSARLKPTATTFHKSGDTDGAGLPYDGLQPVGHVKGPSDSGRPEYLHQPLFFDGDEKLYSQEDCTYVERGDGNGIKIYRPKSDGDPGAFDESASESTYQLVEKSYVDQNSDDFQSHIDIEVATGLGARQRMRFGTSYSIWECNPTSHNKCSLAVGSKGQNECYASAGSSAFDGLGVLDKNDLTTLGRNNFTYPCSAANLITPRVVAGKILPMYWFEESTIHATTGEIDALADIAASYSKAGNVMIRVFAFFTIGMFLGFSMLFLCLCFEKKHSFMNSETPSAPATKTETTNA